MMPMTDINHTKKTSVVICCKALLFFFIITFFSIDAVLAASATLSWNRNQEPDIAGYLISWGTETGKYTNTIFIWDPSNTPSRRVYTINDLEEGKTYYFAFRAVDLAMQISDYSSEVVRDLSTDRSNSYTLLSLYSDTDTEPDFEKYPVISGDMNGDHMDDLVLFGKTGIYVALSEGTKFASPLLWYDYSDNSGESDSLTADFQERGWQVTGTGDINGDGYDDIMLANTDTGTLSIWFMGEAGFDHELVIDQVDFAKNSLHGLADFEGNGSADILWQDNINGELRRWSVDENGGTDERYLGVMQDPACHVEGLGDYDGNGAADILWHNTDYDVYFSCVTRDTEMHCIYLGGPEDTDSSVVASGDFNGDGYEDILWQNVNNGDFYVWLMDSEGVMGTMPLGSVSVSDWKIFGAGDINNDGLADIIWRYDLTGDFIPLLTQQSE